MNYGEIYDKNMDYKKLIIKKKKHEHKEETDDDEEPEYKDDEDEEDEDEDEDEEDENKGKKQKKFIIKKKPYKHDKEDEEEEDDNKDKKHKKKPCKHDKEDEEDEEEMDHKKNCKCKKWKHEDLIPTGRRICKCVKERKGCCLKVLCSQYYKISPPKIEIIKIPTLAKPDNN